MEFWDHLQMQLEHKGFCRVENKKNWYWQEENPVLYLICLLDGAEEGWREENMTFADFAGKMEGCVEEFHCTRVVALSVLVDNQEGTLPVDSVETAFQAYDNRLYRVFWHFSPETGGFPPHRDSRHSFLAWRSFCARRRQAGSRRFSFSGIRRNRKHPSQRQ